MPHILAADLGGTHSRFGHFTLRDGTLALQKLHVCPTSHLRHTDDALAQAVLTGLEPPKADILLLAVAGPLDDPWHARLTNAPLDINLRPLAAQGIRAALVNDFAAQAWASLTNPGAEALPVLPGPADIQEQGPRGILGAGTGLGTALLLPRADATGRMRWTALCAEGGHTAFPFLGEDERAYAKFLQATLTVNYATCEHVLSGRGLALLHRFLSHQHVTPHQITEEYLYTSTGQTTPTARWFARFYGRMCRHWALNSLCRGGLFITGGVAARHPGLVGCPEFREEFLDAPAPLLPLLRCIPVWLIRHEHAGLWGAARAAVDILENTS